jgi:Sap, sulfolipid-1-addressing protein
MALYGFAAAVSAPAALVLSCMVLGTSTRPILSVWILTAGAATLTCAILVIVAVVFGESDSAVRHYLAASLAIALGAVFLGMGLLAIRRESPEKEAKQRERMEGIASSPPGKMFLIGLIVATINFDAAAVFLVGVKQVAETDLSVGFRAGALLLGLALTFILYYGPAILYALFRDWAGRALGALSAWILNHARPMEIIIGVVIGGLFLWHGIADLV